MKFCSHCGGAVAHRVPEGDDRPRFVCSDCETIHYSNPRVIVGCVPEYDGRILLCRRAIEPRIGMWTLPAGFMENGETTLQGAARETWEEARARVCNQELYRIFDVPGINQVYMFYRANIVDGAFGIGPESAEVELFHEDAIPWDEIAFPAVYHTLKEFLHDRRESHWPVRVSAIRR